MHGDPMASGGMVTNGVGLASESIMMNGKSLASGRAMT